MLTGSIESQKEVEYTRDGQVGRDRGRLVHQPPLTADADRV